MIIFKGLKLNTSLNMEKLTKENLLSCALDRTLHIKYQTVQYVRFLINPMIRDWCGMIGHKSCFGAKLGVSKDKLI